MCMTKLQNNDTATFECIINISKAVATTGIICRTDLIHLQVTIHYLVRESVHLISSVKAVQRQV